MTLRGAGVVLVGVLATTACTQQPPPATEPTTIEVSPGPTSPTPTAGPTTASPAPEESTSPTGTPSPPAEPAVWEPSAREVMPRAKALAASIAHRLVNHGPGDTLADRVAGLTDDPDLQGEVEALAEPLAHPGAWSRGQVLYPQLGGARDDKASVMVVVEQQYPTDGEIHTVTRTLDVRLEQQDGGGWRFTGLASIGGEPTPPAADQSPAERAVLSDDRIVLPDSARWDLEDGEASPVLVNLMSRMADRTPYDVVSLSSGHPFHVFGTDRQSKHTMGRAVDVYLLDGDRIVDLREEGSTAHELVEWLYEQPEVSEVGSPWALDDFGGRSFTDVVHQDHIHVGVVRQDSEQATPRTGGGAP